MTHQERFKRQCAERRRINEAKRKKEKLKSIPESWWAKAVEWYRFLGSLEKAAMMMGMSKSGLEWRINRHEKRHRFQDRRPA